jgi:hypothetical protein
MQSLGYLLQVTGLVVTLASLVFFGFRPEMGRMLYSALVGIAIFYLGVYLVKRRA